MQNIILKSLVLLNLFVAQVVSGAELADVKKLSDDGLDRVASTFASYTENESNLWGYYADESSGVLLKLKILSKNPAEKLQNTMKQIIYRSRSQWGTHFIQEVVIVRPLAKNQGNIRGAVHDYAFDVIVDHHENVEFARDELIEVIGKAIIGKNHLNLYVGGDASSFGGCAWLGIVDTQHNEVAVLNSCWAE